MLTVYVFTAGQTTREVFNAVAAFMNTDGFSKAMSIGVMLSIVGCAIQYIRSHDLMQLLKWFGIYFCVSFLLVGVKTTVQIVDLTDQLNPYFVDHVPYGIAMPASIITSLEAGLTKGMESVFHTPDDVNYANTGMLFGAQIFNAVNNGSVILDDTAKNNFNDFVKQCIVPDILINKKYTFDQLANSADIFGFLSSQSMSPLRGIYINQSFTTCAAALPIIQQEIENNVSNQTSLISNFLLGDKTITGADLFSKIQNVYGYMMQMTDSASQILYQNTLINALRSGIGTQIANNDSAAAMLNYGYTNAMQKQLLADNTLARVASYMLPLSQTVFILIMIGIFPVIVLLSLQPLMFFRVLKNYIGSLIYLSTWPILFCIINFVMTTELSFHMTSIAQSQGGLTLTNQNQLLYEAEQFAAYCGYLIALVPVIAGFIFKGLDAVFMNAAQTLVGNMQSWATSSATGIADGNVSLANSSIGNHSWNNWNANKHDSNYTDLSGLKTHQLDNAALSTVTSTGGIIYNTSGATSNLATSIHAGAMISQQLSKSLDHSNQVALQQSESLSHAVNQSWADLSSFSNSHGISTTQGQNFAVSAQTSHTQAVSNIMGIAKDVAGSNRISEHEAYQHLQGNGFNTTVEGGGSVGVPLGRIAATAGAKESFNANYSHTNSYGTSGDTSDVVNISSNEQKQFNENYSLIKNASESAHTDHSSNASASQLSQLSSDFRKSDNIAHQLTSTLTESNRYSEMLNYAESNSANISNNFAQAFTAHLQNAEPQEASEILSNTDNVAIALKREALAESFIKNQYMSQFEKNFNASQSSLNQQYQSESAPISNKSDRVITNFMEQKSGIQSAGSAHGIKPNINTQEMQSQVQGSQSGMSSAIKNETQEITGENHDLSNTIKSKISADNAFIKNK